VPVTLSQIARAARVAKSTASLALRNLGNVDARTRQRVLRAAEKLGYRPNPLVNALMMQVRTRASPRNRPTIGFVNTWGPPAQEPPGIWNVISAYQAGAQERAEELGFDFETISFQPESMTDQRLGQILVARGIEGLVIAPLHSPFFRWNMNWAPFAVAAIGYFEANAGLSRVFYDYCYCVHEVLLRLERLGYRRVGMHIGRADEERSRGLWTAGFLHYFERCPTAMRAVPFPRIDEYEREKFLAWFRAHRPDAILGFGDETLHWLEAIGVAVPDEVGFVSLAHRMTRLPCTGYDHRLEVGAEQFTKEHRRHPVLAVQHQRRRDDGGRIFAAERDHGAHRRVIDRREADIAVGDEIDCGVPVVVAYVDPEELHTQVSGLFVDTLQFADLGAAGSAPLPPHVDHHDLAGEIRERQRFVRVQQVGSRQFPRGAPGIGRVVEDVGLATGRDELERAPLGDRVVTRTAARHQDRQRHRQGDKPFH